MGKELTMRNGEVVDADSDDEEEDTEDTDV